MRLLKQLFAGQFDVTSVYSEWTEKRRPNDGVLQRVDFRSVIWTGNHLVAVGTAIYTSPDGDTWTKRASVANGHMRSVVWTGKLLVAVGVEIADDPGIMSFGPSHTRGIVLTSPDGVEWTRLHRWDWTNFSGVVWTGTKLVSVGTHGSVMVSRDGSSWERERLQTWSTTTKRYADVGIPWDLCQIIWTGNLFLAIGNRSSSFSAIILSSPDGLNWTYQHEAAGVTLYGITWTGKQFIAVGLPGVILTSSDGVEWTKRHSPTKAVLKSVACAGGEIIAVGWKGTTLTSRNAAEWTARKTIGLYDDLNSVVWTGSRLVAVGDGGNILTAP